MTRTAFPAGPMMRISEPGDIGRVLRFAGRLGHQASLSAARLRDLADVVRALSISLVLDAQGGWISVRGLGGGCGPGLEVLAFDRRTGLSEARPPQPWPHLGSQLEALGAVGAGVRVEPTPGGGTAVWTRVIERTDGDAAGVVTADLDVSGLLQAPPGEVSAGWSAVRYGDRLGILICETPAGSAQAAATQELLRTPPQPTPEALWEAHRQVLGQFVRPLGEGGAALVDVDLAHRTARTIGSGRMALTLVADGDAMSTDEESSPHETTVRWERSLSLLAHTTGIRAGADELTPAPAALSCATLMREHREPTPTACVVAARIAAPRADRPG